jgi:hypothetical protein
MVGSVLWLRTEVDSEVQALSRSEDTIEEQSLKKIFISGYWNSGK